VRGFLAGLHLELRIVRASPDALIPLFTTPLFALVFLAIVRNAGRHDLVADALLAPVLMTLWWVAIVHAGALVTNDRWQALLEPVLATPTSLGSVLLGRISALMAFGLLTLFEVWLVGRLVFGVSLPLWHHPWELAVTLVATAFATAGTSLALAAAFVLTRNAYTFINSLSFPLYVLGGVFVPVTFLPGVLEPVARGVFMSWSSDLLRAALKPAAIDDFWARLGVVVLLGAAGFAVGRALLAYVMNRMRAKGELATA
jgi:ABC-2 type transport system permease protein